MAHSPRSISAWHRILRCPASVRLCAQVPPSPGGDAAQAGTLVHGEFERIARGGVQELNLDVILELEALGYSSEWASEMLSVSLAGLAKIAREHDLDRIQFEQRVDPGRLIGRTDCWGTADVIGISRDGRTLVVADLKTGRGYVDPRGNEQMGGYALGALAMDEVPTTIERVVLVILQPPISNEPMQWSCSVTDLRRWGEMVKRRMLLADDPTTAPTPSAKACQWCAAKPVCPAYAGGNRAIAA